MPLNLRASNKLNSFNVPVSYRINDRSGKFIDARNVNSIQDRLDTRFGTSRFNSVSLGGEIKSISTFVKSDGTRKVMAKVGTELADVSETDASLAITGGLSANSKHRAITGTDRHIIAVEGPGHNYGDGLYTWDGSTFSVLGQNAPQAPTATLVAGGGLTVGNKYKVAITFYSSKTGFETSYQYFGSPLDYTSETSEITITTGNQKISLSNLPTTALNLTIDTVIIYLKNTTSNNTPYLYVGEIPLGTATFEIDKESSSSQTPPLNNGPVRAGGGKYLSFFNSKLVYAGNYLYPNEVYFSEEDLPDAFNPFDTATVLVIPGQGPITGLAVGLYGNSVLDPFLVIFKGKSTRIYSEIGDQKKLVVLSEEIGCVSHDTITVKNGVIYFLSEEGWRAIADGRFITNQRGEPLTLGNGDIDDIFKSTGFKYEVNRAGMPNAFSVYYPTLDQYFTWVSEGVNNQFTKTYVYEFDIGGFKPYEFAIPATCATLGEDSSRRDIVLFGTADGFIIKHSIKEGRIDVNALGSQVAINSFAVLPWLPEDGDFDATYNFRELILRALASGNPLTVKSFLNYDLSISTSSSYDFTDPNDGFILDESMLDVGALNDERTTVTARADLNCVGESLAIGFYQSAKGANIGLVSMQIDSSKNGNRNIVIDREDEEITFDAETGTYFPSVSESVRLAQLYAQQAAASAAQAAAGAGLPAGGTTGDFIERDTPVTAAWMPGSFSGFSARFNEMFESTGLLDTLNKILKLTYTAPSVSLSASGSGTVREKGDPVTASTLTASVTKKSDLIDRIRFFLNNVAISGADYNPPVQTGSGNTVHSWTGSFSDNATFKVEVTDDGTSGGPTTVSATTSFTFVYPYYYGSGPAGKTAAQVAALTKYIITSNANLNRVFTPSNGDVFYFAYPASYGALTSILDENGFETLGDWTATTANITGLDATAVSYRIYEFKNPVVAGTTNYTFKR